MKNNMFYDLNEAAEADCFEAYCVLIPFNEWDYLLGEEPSDTHHQALIELAEYDEYSLYDGETDLGELTLAKAKSLIQKNIIRCAPAQLLAA